MKKKQVPQAIINQIHTALKDTSNLIGVGYEDDCVVILKEKNDPDSQFFFKVESIELRQENRTVYTISYLPSNDDNLLPINTNVIASDLTKHLESWVTMVVQFNIESKIFDDPITQKYYDDISLQFELKDVDAEFTPFNHEQQGLLMRLYDDVKSLVEAEKNTENLHEAENIIKAIESAKRNISKETKAQVINRLQKVAAMCMKYSYHIAKLIVEGVIVGTLTKLLTGI